MREQTPGIDTARILTQCAPESVPDDLDLWPSIASRLPRHLGRSRRARLMPRGRLGWVVLTLAGFLVLSGTAYATGPVVNRFFGMYPGTQYVGDAGLAQDVSLSQTIGGLTVTVDHTYADSNQILVGLSLSEVSGEVPLVRIAWLGLADDEKTVFHWERTEYPTVTFDDGKGTVDSVTFHGPDTEGSSPPPPLDPQPATESTWWASQAWMHSEPSRQLVFDASPIRGAPDELRLRLVMHFQLAKTYFPSGEEFLRFDPPPTPEFGAKGYLVGPFDFEFAVPLIEGSVVAVNQTVEAAGVPVTLERVAVTPSETRLYLHFDPPDAGASWVPSVVLEMPNGKLASNAPTPPPPGQTGFSTVVADEETWVLVLTEYLGDQHGIWTLKVTEIGDGMSFFTGEPDPTRLVGPWVFEFEVP